MFHIVILSNNNNMISKVYKRLAQICVIQSKSSSQTKFNGIPTSPFYCRKSNYAYLFSTIETHAHNKQIQSEQIKAGQYLQSDTNNFDSTNIQKMTDYKDQFLLNLMSVNYYRNHILKVMDHILNDYQLNRTKELNQRGQNHQNVQNNINDKKQENQQIQSSQHAQIQGQNFEVDISFAKVKFFAYVYNLYPKKVNFGLADIMICEYFKAKLRNQTNLDCLSVINQFQGFLKLMYQSQFYKGNYEQVKNSLKYYTKFLVKLSQLLTQQFTNLNLFQAAKTLEKNHRQQVTQKRIRLAQHFRVLIYAFPIFNIDPAKNSTQQRQLVTILNQQYFQIVNNYFEILKSFNKMWILQHQQNCAQQLKNSNYNSLIKYSFSEHKNVYKILTDILLMVVQHQQKGQNFRNKNNGNNQKNMHEKNSIASFEFNFSLMFQESILTCKDQVQFLKILQIIQSFMSFSLFRKINLKQVNMFYKGLFKLNMNQNRRLVKNQKVKVIIWNHLSKHVLYLNYGIMESLNANYFKLI